MRYLYIVYYSSLPGRWTFGYSALVVYLHMPPSPPSHSKSLLIYSTLSIPLTVTCCYLKFCKGGIVGLGHWDIRPFHHHFVQNSWLLHVFIAIINSIELIDDYWNTYTLKPLSRALGVWKLPQVDCICLVGPLYFTWWNGIRKNPIYQTRPNPYTKNCHFIDNCTNLQYGHVIKIVMWYPKHLNMSNWSHYIAILLLYTVPPRDVSYWTYFSSTCVLNIFFLHGW